MSFVFNEVSDYYIIGYQSSDTPGNALLDKNIRNVIIPSVYNQKFVREIGDRAFQYTNITSAFVPYSIRVLRRGCLNGCSFLRKIIFEKNSQLTTILEAAFSGSVAIRKIDIPSTVVTITTNQALFDCCQIQCISYLGAGDFSSAKLFASSDLSNMKAYVMPTHPSKLGGENAAQIAKKCIAEYCAKTLQQKKVIDCFWLNLMIVLLYHVS